MASGRDYSESGGVVWRPTHGTFYLRLRGLRLRRFALPRIQSQKGGWCPLSRPSCSVIRVELSRYRSLDARRLPPVGHRVSGFAGLTTSHRLRHDAVSDGVWGMLRHRLHLWRCWGSLEAGRWLMYSPGGIRTPPVGYPPFGGTLPGGSRRGPGGAPRARKFPEIPPGPRGPPGGPRRAHFGGFWGLLHRALDRIWGGIPGGVFPAQFVPKMAKKKFNLSRLGELLNTLRNVHPRPPGGGRRGAPGGPPGGPPGGGSPGWVSGGVQGPPDMTPRYGPPDIPPEDNPRI